MGSRKESVPDREIDDNELPLDVIQSAGRPKLAGPSLGRRKLPRFLLVLLVPLILFTGSVIGIYVQPPALRAFLRLTGLKPGGGTSSPIAVPMEDISNEQPEQSTMRSVVAHGRLAPKGEVITISPPFGAGDSRIDEIRVEIGSRVERGETLALLDNRASLESAVASADANVALQRTTLEQTRMTIAAIRKEAIAALDGRIVDDSGSV